MIEYLNDIIIEGGKVVEGGWILHVPRLPPSRGLENRATVLAIQDRV